MIFEDLIWYVYACCVAISGHLNSGIARGGRGIRTPHFCSDPSWDLCKSVQKCFIYRGSLTEKNFVFLIANLKIMISMRSWARTSLRIKNITRTSSKVKNLIKNLIKNQDSQWEKILIENLKENLNEVLPRSWFFDEVLDEVLDSQWGFDEVEVLDSQWGSCPRPHWDFDFGTILLRFSMRKTKLFP